MIKTTENKDLSLANNLHLHLISFDKSLIYIYTKMDPCATQVQI